MTKHLLTTLAALALLTLPALATAKTEGQKKFSDMEDAYGHLDADAILSTASSFIQGADLCENLEVKPFVYEAMAYGAIRAVEENLDIESLNVADRGFTFLRAEISRLGSIQKYCDENLLEGTFKRK